MDFISLHEKVTENQNLSLFLISKYQYDCQKLQNNIQFDVNENHILLILDGLVSKRTEFIDEETYQYTFYTKGDIIFKINKNERFYLENIKNGKVAIFTRDEVFDGLEEDGLLPHLFLEQYLKAEGEINFLTLQFLDSRKRIIRSILKLAELYQDHTLTSRLIFPKEITVTKLAKYCNCNRVTASKTINELKHEHYLLPTKEGLEIVEREKLTILSSI